MKTKLVMMYDERVPFGPSVEALNCIYADRRGYDFVTYHHFPDPNLDPYWNRIRVMQQELETCDQLWWIDADAFFLRNDMPLPVLTRDVGMSKDWNGICCGVMAIRNTSWTHRLLTAWQLMGNVDGAKIKGFDNGQFREQTTLKAMCHFWPEVQAHFEIISEAVIQNPTAQFCESALMLHMWNGFIGAERVKTTIDRFNACKTYEAGTLERP